MKNKGFNIVELIVVIVIMGVLTMIAIPAFRGVFMRGRLEEARNQVFAFYQRTQRYATTTGISYKLQIDRGTERLRCMEENVAAAVKDSLILDWGLDLNHLAGASNMVFTVEADGFVRDDDNIREFRIDDSNTGKSLVFYISPLGVMEVNK